MPSENRRGGPMPDLTIGVLSLQGDVEEHIDALLAMKVDGRGVKTPEDLADVDGLIIPGGESTTVGEMIGRFGLTKPLEKRVAAGMPVWGTCMGMIVLAKKVQGSIQPTLGLLSIEVKRNAFGRQVESAEVPLDITGVEGKPFPGVFIRAPWIENARDDARVLARLDGHGVMVRQKRILGTSFHPELTDDLRVHRYFAEMVAAAKRSA
ncbi:MAG TPA: pyridoxal 5'-phosphate synthase glutaminase subunit PdxT [Candidatus Eremiobacteraceae bacterium]|nr:pyridoxal 5'-phosphate synthase glutaminase subunit PdxT [Candidatus Eremiobacteraceae bacterium]